MRTEPWGTLIFKGWTQAQSLKDRLKSFNIREMCCGESRCRGIFKAEGLDTGQVAGIKRG